MGRFSLGAAAPFRVGELVERREAGGDWARGFVTSAEPLKVTVEDKLEAYVAKKLARYQVYTASTGWMLSTIVYCAFSSISTEGKISSIGTTSLNGNAKTTGSHFQSECHQGGHLSSSSVMRLKFCIQLITRNAWAAGRPKR